jgi:hypothetical protein
MNRLLERPKNSRLLKFDNADGSLPVILLPNMLKLSNFAERFPTWSGSPPVKELEDKPRYWSCPQLEMEDRKSRLPVKLLSNSSRTFRARMFPSVSGTDPDNEFVFNDRKDSFDKFPREVGS